MEDTIAPTHRPMLARAVAAAGHPLLLVGALGLWWALGANDGAMLATLAAVLVVSMLLERLIPAEPAWRLGLVATLRLAGVYLLSLIVSGGLITVYESLLPAVLAGVRARLGLAVLPADWPLLAQALLLWRVSGHGFHHGFQNLHAINVGTNHPFELVLLALPLVLVAAAFGAPAAAVDTAGVLLITNVMLAHANVRMETPVFSALFTCSDQHRRHHSAVFEDSNTNYACNAILWDRVFGTYSRGPVLQTGIGPTQPPLWRMFLLPFGEPDGVDTVATRARRGS